jgi:hypothetical protein
MFKNPVRTYDINMSTQGSMSKGQLEAAANL